MQSWLRYYKRRGTFNTNRKLEWGFALLAHLIDNALGGKKTQADFMPYYEDDDAPISLERAMETWD